MSIAAAPDLFEIVSRFIAWADSADGVDDDRDDAANMIAFGDLCVDARAAISKAATDEQRSSHDASGRKPVSRDQAGERPALINPSEAVAEDCEKQAIVLEKFILDGDKRSELLRVQNALRCAAAVIRHYLLTPTGGK